MVIGEPGKDNKLQEGGRWRRGGGGDGGAEVE